jgi:hypothetical protein
VRESLALFDDAMDNVLAKPFPFDVIERRHWFNSAFLGLCSRCDHLATETHAAAFSL